MSLSLRCPSHLCCILIRKPSPTSRTRPVLPDRSTFFFPALPQAHLIHKHVGECAGYFAQYLKLADPVARVVQGRLLVLDQEGQPSLVPWVSDDRIGDRATQLQPVRRATIERTDTVNSSQTRARMRCTILAAHEVV